MTPDDLLEQFTPEVRDLANVVRRLVRDTVPGASARAYPGWKGIGYHDAQAGYFCGVFPQGDHVRLLFEHGAALPDPDGLLEGDGRQVRYLVLRPGRRVPRRAVVRMLQAALLHGAVR